MTRTVGRGMSGKIHIGTSGWNYEGWKGPLYPDGISGKDLLPEYASHFKTCEINNTFYNTPSDRSVIGWRMTTPDDFIFAVKASRYITHRKKLNDPEQSTKRFFDAVEQLENKLGPILFQLPPRWHYNHERLAAFLKSLPAGHRYAFEFRDQSWLNDDAYALLAKHKANLCFYDFKQFRNPEKITADFVYIRLHGPQAEAYGGSYSDDDLQSYADKIKQWQRSGDVFCYFDNDQKACAPHDAKRLIALLR